MGADRGAVEGAAGRARRLGRFGFYTSGQLFLEEYYTLGVIGKAGLGTPHMDGNTRLCTATAAAALKESFGTDGQPGSLHRRRPLRRDRAVGPQRGGDPDGALDADARPPARAEPAGDARGRPARHAGGAGGRRPPGAAHGTNVALMNGLLHELIASDWDRPTSTSTRTPLGFEELRPDGRATTRRQRVAEICDVPAADDRAGRRAPRHAPSGCCPPCCRASTSPTRPPPRPCQVNNIHLLRGMLGRPGAASCR